MEAGARRVVVVLLGLLLGFGAMLTAAFLWAGDEAVQQTISIAWHRSRLERETAPRERGTPLIVWMGDSTMELGGVPGYPRTVAFRLEPGRPGVEHRHAIVPGLDPFHFYYLMGTVLPLAPDLVVIGTSLRMFVEKPLGAPRNDLCSGIPVSELPRAAALPMSVRGVTIPRLALCRALNLPFVADLVFGLEGIRRVLQTHMGFDSSDTRLGNAEQRYELDARTIEGLTPEQPAVEMLLASLEMAQRSGTRTMLVMSPVNREVLGSAGFDAAVYADRIGMLRRLVEERGATLVDLHAAVPTDGFIDAWGHLNLRGIEVVASRLSEEIAGLKVFPSPAP